MLSRQTVIFIGIAGGAAGVLILICVLLGFAWRRKYIRRQREVAHTVESQASSSPVVSPKKKNMLDVADSENARATISLFGSEEGPRHTFIAENTVMKKTAILNGLKLPGMDNKPQKLAQEMVELQNAARSEAPSLTLPEAQNMSEVARLTGTDSRSTGTGTTRTTGTEARTSDLDIEMQEGKSLIRESEYGEENRPIPGIKTPPPPPRRVVQSLGDNKPLLDFLTEVGLPQYHSQLTKANWSLPRLLDSYDGTPESMERLRTMFAQDFQMSLRERIALCASIKAKKPKPLPQNSQNANNANAIEY